MADKIIGNELFWLAAMAPPLIFSSACSAIALGKRSKASTTASPTLPSRPCPRRNHSPGLFVTFIALQLLWAATDDHRVTQCEREHQARLAKCFDEREDKKSQSKT